MKKFCTYFNILTLAAMLMVGVDNAWGAWAGSGKGTQVNGVWYVLNSSSEISVGLWGTSEALELSGPGAVLTFQAKRQTAAFNSGFYAQQSTDKGANWSKLCDISCSTSYADKSQNVENNVTSIRFKHDSPGSLTKYVRNVKVTMATYFENPSKSALAYNEDKIGKDSVQKVTIAWCNTPNMTWRVENNGGDDVTTQDVEVTWDYNSEPGKYNTSTLSVKFTRAHAGTLKANLIISSGSVSKTIALTGEAGREMDEVSFETGRSIILMDEEYDADWAVCNSGTAITYTSSDPSVLKIENNKIIAVARGVVTLTASSAGNSEYTSASGSIIVKVRNNADPCESLLLDVTKTVQFKSTDDDNTYALQDGPRGTLKYQWKKLTAITLDGTNKLWGYDSATNKWRELKTLSTPKTSWVDDSYTFTAADQSITKLKWTSSTEDGSKYVRNAAVSQLSYLTPSTKSLNMSEVALCETATAEMTIDYSDLSRIQFQTDAEGLTYEVWQGGVKLTDFSNDCHDYGTYTLKLFYTPAMVGSYTKTFTLSAAGKSETISISGNVTPAVRTLTWDIPSGNTIFATQSLDLDAYASTACEDIAGTVTYTASPAEAVVIDGNHVTFLYKATVTITAHASESDRYTMPATIDKVWTVEKTGVKMVTLPTITSDIHYGDTKSVVTWANDWQAVDVLTETPVEGVINYVGPDNFNAIGEQLLTFNFTPSQLTIYDALQFTVPVTVLPAVSSATATAANITYGQPVSASALTNNGPTEGTWAWAADIQNEVLAVGEHEGLAVVFTPTDPNYSTIHTTVSLTVVEAPADNVFIGTDGDWSNADNWQAGVVPSTTTGVNITVTEGSNLTIGTDATIGNMIVEAGGRVDIADDAAVQVVNDFRIDSRYTSSDEAASGHVSDPGKIAVTGNAYMELTLDPSGQAQRGWYAFSVPFEVDMANGVYAIRGGEQTHIVNAVDYKVQYYSESRRAAGQYGWVRENSTLHPGVLYIITVDNRVEQNIIVFRAANTTMTAAADVPVHMSAAGAAADKGWNGIGNATLGYAQLPAGTKLQVYNFADQCYDQKEADEVALVVGSGAFVQVSDEGTLPLTMVEPHNAATAPHRATARVLDEFRVDLSREDGTECDRLYLSASEEATGEYTIGHDLVKMQPSATKAQLWSSAYGKQLCDVEMPLLANKALVPLTLSTPTDDTYVLSVARTPDDAMLYLTYNGKIIWNLSMSEYYLDLAAGTDSAYGLLMVANNAPAITTGVDDAEQGDGVLKQIIDNKLYITLPNGMIFDATGSKIQ